MGEEELEEECLPFLGWKTDTVVFDSDLSTVVAGLDWGPDSCRWETPVTITTKLGQPMTLRPCATHSPDATLLSVVISQWSEQV